MTLRYYVILSEKDKTTETELVASGYGVEEGMVGMLLCDTVLVDA